MSSRNSATRRKWSRRAPAASRISDVRLRVGIVEQVVAGSAPPLLETTATTTPRRERRSAAGARLDRERGENPLRERVQRADRGVVELIERADVNGRARSGTTSRGAAARTGRAHPVAQLGRGLLRERDRGDAAHRNREVGTVGRHQLHDPRRRGPWSCPCPRPPRRTASRRGAATARPRRRVVVHRSAGCRLYADQLEVLIQLGRGSLPQPGAVRVDGAQTRRGRSIRTRSRAGSRAPGPEREVPGVDPIDDDAAAPVERLLDSASTV